MLSLSLNQIVPHGPYQGWTGKLFFSRAEWGGERQGKKSTGQGGVGNPPFPTMRGGAGKGSKSAGRGEAGRGTYCVYQLIEIICCSKGNLNLHCKLIYSIFITLIVITISITIIIIISIIASINAIIINCTKDDIQDMGELFHLLTNFREQRLMPC